MLALFPWGASDKSHVLILALDGTTLSDFERFGGQGFLPNISYVLARSRLIPIASGDRGDSRAFWTTVFSADSVARGPASYLWTIVSMRGLSAVAVGVPGTSERIGAPETVLPGADEAAGFIGDNVGRVLDPSTTLATLGWPYEGAVSRAAVAAEALEPGAASPWITVSVSEEGARTGAFRMYRLADGWLWVSPVYRSARNARSYRPDAPDDLFYVADDPGWLSGSDRRKDYYFVHEDDLANGRSRLAALLAAEGPTLLVYFDPSIALLEAAYSEEPGEGADPEVLRKAYTALDKRIGYLRSAAPDSTSVVLLGRRSRRAPLDSQTAAPRGFLAISGSAMDRRAPELGKMEPEQVGTFLLTALLSAGGASVPKENAASSPLEPTVPLTPESLRQLGLLSSTSIASFARTEDARESVTVSSPSNR